MVRIAQTLAALSDGTAVIASPGGVTAALGGQGGRFSARLDLLTHFAPVWLVGALLATGYTLISCFAAVALGAWRGLGVAGAAGGGGPDPAGIDPLDQPGRGRAGAPRQIKLIQFNAWDENAQPGATADWIAAQKPDLVMMQEVENPIRQAMIHRGFHYGARHGPHRDLQPRRADLFAVPGADGGLAALAEFRACDLSWSGWPVQRRRRASGMAYPSRPEASRWRPWPGFWTATLPTG